MISCVVVGAAGRMGRFLVTNVMETEGIELIGAVEYPASPFVGQDAGEVAGCGTAGVKITGDITPLLAKADVVINFATDGVLECAEKAVAAGAAMVIGTTTLGDEGKAELKALTEKGGRIVAAGNMSVGVNLLYKLVSEAARILGEAFDVEIVEMHHNRKKDAPSGTAARLAEVVCETLGRDRDDLVYGREGLVGERSAREIGMHSLRGGDVVGDHTVYFASEGERIELTHRASSRNTFARGAVRAAKWITAAEPGLYDMQDVLGFK